MTACAARRERIDGGAHVTVRQVKAGGVGGQPGAMPSALAAPRARQELFAPQPARGRVLLYCAVLRCAVPLIPPPGTHHPASALQPARSLTRQHLTFKMQHPGTTHCWAFRGSSTGSIFMTCEMLPTPPPAPTLQMQHPGARPMLGLCACGWVVGWLCVRLWMGGWVGGVGGSPGSIFMICAMLPMPATILYCFRKSLKSNLAAGWGVGVGVRGVEAPL